jgi:hypothetical protein
MTPSSSTAEPAPGQHSTATLSGPPWRASATGLSGFWKPKQSRPRLIAILLAYQMTGLSLALAEIAARWARHPDEPHIAVPQTFVVLVAAGTALGLIAAAIEYARQFFQIRPHAFYPVLVAPALIAVGLKLTSGAWISRQWFAPYGVSAAALFGTAALWSAIRLANGAASQWLVPHGLTLAAIVFAVLDLRVLPGLYPTLHDALLIAAWTTGAAAMTRALLLVRPWERRVYLRPWAIAAALVGASSVPLAFWKGPTLAHRALWTRAPGYATQVYEPAHLAYWTYQLRRSGADDGYAQPIAAWINQQPDKQRLRHENAIASWNQANAHDARRHAVPTRAGAPSNILLVTVDALRADVAKRGANFAEIAKRGLSFERAYAPAAVTDRSLPRLLSGRFDWREYDENVLRGLNEAGYDTAFVTDTRVRDYLRHRDQNWLNDPQTVLTVDDVQARSARLLAERTLDFLRTRRSDRPLFLWVHFADVHQWREIAAADRRLGSPRDQYEAAWVEQDAVLGQFIRGAQALLAERPTATILTSDHGEYLGEFGRIAHGRWIDLAVTHVPLVVIAPGLTPHTVDRPVALFDVAPTIAEFAHLKGFTSDAVSLLHDNVDPLRPLIMADSREIGIVRGAFRLTLQPISGLVSAFDDSNPASPRALAAAELRQAVGDLLLPLLGSPVATAALSPLDVR